MSSSSAGTTRPNSLGAPEGSRMGNADLARRLDLRLKWKATLTGVVPMAIVSDRSGRILVLDATTQKISAYDNQGSRLGGFGGRWPFPVGFAQAIGMLWDCAGRLWVADFGEHTFVVFDPLGHELGRHAMPGNRFPMPLRAAFDSVGRLHVLVGTVDTISRLAILTYSDSLRVLDSMALPLQAQASFIMREAGRSAFAHIPFAPVQDVAIDANGNAWVANGSSIEINRFGLGNRDLASAIINQPRRRVTDAELGRALQDLTWFTVQGGRVDTTRIPRYPPSHGVLFVDSRNRLWVGQPRETAQEGHEFEIFDSDGKSVGNAHGDFQVISQIIPVVSDRGFLAIARGDSGETLLVLASIEGH